MNLPKSEELRDKEYRHGIVNAQIEVDLPLQIRALRKQLVGTQPEMAALTGMRQPRISAMEKPGGAHFTLETLRRLAEAFDVALIVRFAPFSELLDWSGKFNPDTFRVPGFTEEAQAQEDRITEAENAPAAMSAGQFGSLKGLGIGTIDSETFRRIQNEAVKAVQGYTSMHVQGLTLKELGIGTLSPQSGSITGGGVRTKTRRLPHRCQVIVMPKRNEGLQVRDHARRKNRATAATA
jgi:transcriptional regulator with XRE-family HTH domain